MARVKTATRAITNGGGLCRTLVLPATAKAVGELPTESLVEYDGLLEMIYDPDIVSVQVQPEVVALTVGTVNRAYTPDVKFVRRDGRIGYREFKQSLKDLDADTLEKLNAAAKHFASSGYEYSVVEVGQLRHGSRLSNIRLLKRYSRWPSSVSVERQIQEHLRRQGQSSLHELRDLVGPAAYGNLYRMLWDQRLRADLDIEPLSGATRIWEQQP